LCEVLFFSFRADKARAARAALGSAAHLPSLSPFNKKKHPQKPSHLSAPDFGRLLCVCKALRAALGGSEACHARAAALFRVDGAQLAPLSDAELCAAAVAALEACVPGKRRRGVSPKFGGDVNRVVRVLTSPTAGAAEKAGALQAARAALPDGFGERRDVRLFGRVGAYAWASHAAPVVCGTWKEVVGR
jgi:hypothetical protein